MSHAAVAQDETEDRYHTQVEAGDVRLFTLDQLDAAFNVGLIHENTFVCLEGSTEWLTLGEVAGLGDEEPVSAPFPVAAPVSSYTAPPSVIPAAPYSVIPAAPYSAAPVVMPRSIAPVVNDLSFDDDYEMMAMRPKRRIGKVMALLAVAGLAAAGFAVVQSGGIKGVKLPKLDFGSSASQATAASLSVSTLKDTAHTTPQPPAPEPPKVEETKPADVAPTPATEASKASADKATDKPDADKAEKTTSDRFSEDMKAALLNKDKQHVVEQKHKKAARVAVATKQKPSGKSAKGTPGFKSGGSAYDPLNSKL
jgi:hypothetical protein